MYYILEQDRNNSVSASFSDANPGHHMKWYKGQKFEKNELPSDLQLHIDNNDIEIVDQNIRAVYPDFFTGTATAFCSEKMRQLLDKAGIQNIEYYPLVIIEEGGRRVEGHYAMNILGRIACLDKTQSECNYFEGEIVRIKSMAIDESLVHDIPIFRLHELPDIILVSEKIANVTKGLVGIQLSPAEGWNDSHLF
jgi:hypothetical protein